MPYVSKKQQRFFHTKAAKKAGITPAEVSEFDKATDYASLPERATKSKKKVRMHKK